MAMEIRNLKVDLLCLGARVPGLEKGRRAGAGPAAGGMFIVGDTVANVATQSWFVAQSPYRLDIEDNKYVLKREGKRIAEVEAKARVASLVKCKASAAEIADGEASLVKASLAYKEAKSAKNKLDKGKDMVTKKVFDPANLARELLEDNSLMKAGKIRRLPAQMAPKASWILKEELELLLWKHVDEVGPEAIEDAMNWFARMERGLSQRFSVIARAITMLCALGVALVFQVSAPDVLKRLSTDPEYRAQAEGTAANLLERYEANPPSKLVYQDFSAKALDELAKRHPEVDELLEEVSGVGNSKAAIVDELAMVLEDHPQQAALTDEYELILDKLQRQGYERAAKMVEENVGSLAKFDIVPFSRGKEFYWSLSNILGMLMTTVLIGLGAPFWFNTLQRLVALRDALKPKEEKKAQGDSSA